MKIEVLLFAAARERAGTDRAVVELSGGATVADLRAALCRQFPALHEVAGHLMVTLDQQYAGPDDPVSPSMEVACFPPVSGG